jgi:putative endonuclease
MGHVYILRSSAGKYYVGSCAVLEERLEQHKNKTFKGSYTALSADDWTLFYHIDDLDYNQSRLIEKHIKNMKSKKYIENLKRYPAIAERLKEKYK